MMFASKLGVHDVKTLIWIATLPFIAAYVATIWLVHRLALRWSLNDNTALVATVLYAFHWIPLAFGSTVYPRTIATLCIVASSAGCILTTDLPDPALDIPDRYKAARLTDKDAPPTLDWWRGFRSKELTDLMEEAQTVNLDIAAATARFIQADAQARITGAALLPSLQGNGSETYSRTSGASASGLSIGGREVVNYTASLSAAYELDFWGKNRDATQAAEETAFEGAGGCYQATLGDDFTPQAG